MTKDESPGLLMAPALVLTISYCYLLFFPIITAPESLTSIYGDCAIMLSKQLGTALKFTVESHSDTFERFANSFLLSDYPELEGLGGKQDKGMDARVVVSESGQNQIVFQSCVSPRNRAASKIEATLEKLTDNMPLTLVYSSSATIGVSLDDTKRKLRQSSGVTLEVRDATWFIERSMTNSDRMRLSEAYALEILRPLYED